ncbi:hypothetical protein [Cellulosimicrobium sp. Marseille-Q4280]|uniref:hypothetical protein n=1 Tax=Cellulosimicrobium sp. Marseille-Q4280 TaxID=2937992 RepID=UPI00204159B9|nr:hypothetical protein [Cellulosimicrobium sp. Marseille-Q4280]
MARRRVSGRSVPTASAAPALVALAMLLSACGGGAGGVPDREPDVTGVVERTGTGALLTEPSDDYFDGMSLMVTETPFVGADGEPIESAGLATGDEVEVWLTGSCAESHPVQCELVAVRVVG